MAIIFACLLVFKTVLASCSEGPSDMQVDSLEVPTGCSNRMFACLMKANKHSDGSSWLICLELLQFHWDCVEAEDADVFNFQLTEDDMKDAQHRSAQFSALKSLGC